MSSLNNLKNTWEKLGDMDPLWAILAAADKKGNKWNPEEFFATGVLEIDNTLHELESMNIQIGKARALDFGCGVGRLSQALAGHFDEVYGVDIASSMIDKAREYNRFGDRCKYILNQSPDLKQLEDCKFDFIYSTITLQHMAPEYSRSYIDEFLRLLRPGGVVIFDLPNEPQKAQKLKLRLMNIFDYAALRFLYKAVFRRPPLEMYSVRREDVLKQLDMKSKVLKVAPSQCGGAEWRAFRYYVAKI
jgi:2-polyprenyl-3-methyl-5-hydroxy-6-metoxy-1,4-benzoquinol methylase